MPFATTHRPRRSRRLVRPVNRMLEAVGAYSADALEPDESGRLRVGVSFNGRVVIAGDLSENAEAPAYFIMQSTNLLTPWSTNCRSVQQTGPMELYFTLNWNQPLEPGRYLFYQVRQIPELRTPLGNYAIVYPCMYLQT